MEDINVDINQNPTDKTKILYNAVSKDYNVGSFDEFSKKLQDPSKREAFYKGVGSEYNLGSYDEFSKKVGAVEKKNLGGTISPTELPASSPSQLPKSSTSRLIVTPLAYADDGQKAAAVQPTTVTEKLFGNVRPERQQLDVTPKVRNVEKEIETEQVGKQITSDAIKNTLKAYKDRLSGDGAYKISDTDPALINQKNDLEKDLKEGNLQVVKSKKTGQYILARKNDSIGSISQAYNNVKDKQAEDRFVANLSTIDKIKHYENKKALVKDEYLPSEPSGFGGAFGTLIGENITPLAELAAATTVVGKYGKYVGLAGDALASAKKFTSFLTFATDAGYSGYANNTEKVYNALRTQNPNGDKVSQMQHAERAGLVGEVSGLAGAGAMTGAFARLNTAAKNVNVQPLVSSLEQLAHHTVKESATQGAFAAGGSILSDLGAISQGVKMKPSEIAAGAAESAKGIAEFTAVMGSAMGIAAGFANVPKYVKAQATGILAKLNPVLVNDAYKEAEASGAAPIGTAEKAMQQINGFKEAQKKVPTDLPDENVNAISGIQQKIDKLEAQKKTLAPQFHDRIDAVIDSLRNRSKEIASSDKPLEKEVDDITQQPTNIKIESAVAEEVTPVVEEVKPEINGEDVVKKWVAGVNDTQFTDEERKAFNTVPMKRMTELRIEFHKNIENTAKELDAFHKLLLSNDVTNIEKEKRNAYYNILMDNELKNAQELSEAYHRSKEKGSNPELVKAVEDLLGKEKPKVEEPVEVKPTIAKEEVKPEGKVEHWFSQAVGNDINKSLLSDNSKDNVWGIQNNNGEYEVSKITSSIPHEQIEKRSSSLIDPLFNEDNIYNEGDKINIIKPAKLQKNADGSFSIRERGLIRYGEKELPKEEVKPTEIKPTTTEVKSNKDVSKVFDMLLKDKDGSEDYGIHGLLADLYGGAEYNEDNGKITLNETRSGTGKMSITKKEFINDILSGKAEKEIPDAKEYINKVKQSIYDELGIKQETTKEEVKPTEVKGSVGVGGDVEATAKALEDLSKNKTERFYPDDKVILITKDGKEVEVSFRGYNGEKKAVIFGSRGSGINQMEVDVSQLRAKNKSDKLTKDERNNLLSKIDFQDKEAPTYKDDFTDKELQDLSVRYPKRDKLSNKEKNDLNDFQIATTPLKRWQEQEYGVDDSLDTTNIRLAKEHETAINNIINNDKFSTLLAEAYHKAKADETNPELVEAVEQSLKETTKEEVKNEVEVFHGGTIDKAEDLAEGEPLFVSESESQAKEYTKENEGKVKGFKIDKNKIATEEEARDIIKKLGLKPKEEGWSADELNLFELIDPKFETSLSEKDIQKVFNELKKKGYEGVSFMDTNLKTLKQDIQNIAIFDPKETLFKEKTKENAIQEPSTSSVLQYPQEGARETGGERGRVEPSKQGEAIAEKVKQVEGNEEEVKPKEYTSKTGRQKIVYDEKGNSKVIDTKTGKEVSRETAKKVFNEAADNYDFSKGKKASFEGVVEGDLKREEGDNYIIDNSSNPAEIAEIYARQELEPPVLNSAETAIVNHGIGKVTPESFKRFGDKNYITLGLAKHWFARKGKSGNVGKEGFKAGRVADIGGDIDDIAKSISDKMKVPVSPQDIVDFIVRFPSGASEKLVENQTAYNAREKFEKLTGLPLTEEIAHKAIDYEFNKLTKEQQAIAEQDFKTRKQLEDAYWAEQPGAVKPAPEKGDNIAAKQTAKAEKGLKEPIVEKKPLEGIQQEYQEVINKTGERVREKAKLEFVERNFDSILNKLKEKIKEKCPT